MVRFDNVALPNMLDRIAYLQNFVNGKYFIFRRHITDFRNNVGGVFYRRCVPRVDLGPLWGSTERLVFIHIWPSYGCLLKTLRPVTVRHMVNSHSVIT